MIGFMYNMTIMAVIIPCHIILTQVQVILFIGQVMTGSHIIRPHWGNKWFTYNVLGSNSWKGNNQFSSSESLIDGYNQLSTSESLFDGIGKWTHWKMDFNITNHKR
eukprot:434848_1